MNADPSIAAKGRRQRARIAGRRAETWAALYLQKGPGSKSAARNTETTVAVKLR
ncbi:MAG: hypothetical protein WDN02_06625 [Methylovirgula sp.]|uniref:hypothetical protein n=1 Tax=Methylovirgula sp. TaxID=1978224 RepID=UPI0030762D37